MSKRQILRVFPRQTAMTPQDKLAIIGPPDLFDYPYFDEIRVSCVFTWDKEKAFALAHAWETRYPDKRVRIGGPGFDDAGGKFTPGVYVRRGVTISSRGCPNKCPWCFVSKREGELRIFEIIPGYIVQDNNITAWPKTYFRALCDMLVRENLKGHKARFPGGLEARRLTSWQAKQLHRVAIQELWFAADTDAAINPLKKALAFFRGYDRRKLRCYVMLGYNGETMAQAEARLEKVWELGCLPFAQLYKDEEGGPVWSKQWKQFARKWQRPTIMFAMHKEVCVP